MGVFSSLNILFLKTALSIFIVLFLIFSLPVLVFIFLKMC
jgi:hypothetical protein